MRILHLSFHVGCINDFQYIFKTLGHAIEYMKMSLPGCKVTAEIADKIWQEKKDTFQSYDIILTSDTVGLSYIFLRHLDELAPHLLIFNTNRFDYGMYEEPMFYKLLQELPTHRKKITFIPVSAYEFYWCGRKGLCVSELPILPVGKWLTDDIFYGEYIRDDFGEINRCMATKDDAQTIFIQTYFNHIRFMNLPKLLSDFGVSVAFGGYRSFHEIAGFKGLVILPDATCKYFAFESIQNELLVFLPTQRFLLELSATHGYFFNTEGSGGKITPETINLCEWYRYPETRIFFDSFPDLFVKIQTTTQEQIAERKRWMRFYGAQHEKEQLLRWAGVLERISMMRADC